MRKIVFNHSLWPSKRLVKLNHIIGLKVPMTPVIERLCVIRLILDYHVTRLLLLLCLAPVMCPIIYRQFVLAFNLVNQRILTPSLMQHIKVFLYGFVIVRIFHGREAVYV